MIIIYKKSTGELVRFATNPSKFRMKLENRVIPVHELATIKDPTAIPDDRPPVPGALEVPTYNYKDLEKKYAYVEITDKPTARKIRTDPDPALQFTGDKPTSVLLSTGETIKL